MGKWQKFKVSRFEREVARNSGVAEDIYNGKIKRTHVNKYENVKHKKKYNKNPVNIDNKIKVIANKEIKETVNSLVSQCDKMKKTINYFNYTISIIVIILLVIFGIKLM